MLEGGNMRVASVGALCLLAALSPFIAGRTTAVFGLVPLSGSIWLVAKLPWSRTHRVVVSVAIVVATIALFLGVLIVVVSHSYN
jgi:hypothetical protein